MKIPKGGAGYISGRKRQLLLKTLLEFGIVAALLILGYMQTGTKKNLLTVVAIVGCLPASKSAVGWLSLLPYKTIAAEKAGEIKEKAALLTAVYDMVLTSRDKIMPVDCFVISGRTVCGYTKSRKVDVSDTAEYLKEMFALNGFEKVTVKIFAEYKPFLARAEGMNKIASIDQSDSSEYEQRLKALILSLSM